MVGAKKRMEVSAKLGSTMGGQARPHVLIIPFPAQGHVGPLMKLAHRISDHGIKVTFVNSHFIHGKVVAALPPDEAEARGRVRVQLASIPDGLEPGDDRRDLVKLTESITRVMPGHLKGLIEKINNENIDEKITCVIADTTTSWGLEVAEEMGIIQRVVFCPCGLGSMAVLFHIPRLVQSGIINSTDGSSLKDELICLGKDVPDFSSDRMPWSCPIDPPVQETCFGLSCQAILRINLSNFIICNSVYELDSSACDLIPNMLPIGPLLATDIHPGRYAGNLWLQDQTCLSWLDNQPADSVIYVAFGSLAILSQHQLNELALGLELAGRPFLWVVRSYFADGSAAEFPDGFLERVSNDHHGKIVSWAPQEEVLSHPSVACFLSHCGWNSTMDGLAMGVPFLCWPYFVDQFHNQSYICNKWKVGLELINSGENRFISRHEIKKKIEELVSNEGIQANAEKLKEMARKSANEGGSSYNNFKTFIEAIKH